MFPGWRCLYFFGSYLIQTARIKRKGGKKKKKVKKEEKKEKEFGKWLIHNIV